MVLPRSSKKKVVCVDFDGVLYPNLRYFSTADLRGEPVSGAREFIRKLQEEYEVVVHSCRCENAEGREAVQAYLTAHGFDLLAVANKPVAHVYLDDRAVCFNGDFTSSLAEIAAFKQWQTDDKARARIVRKRHTRGRRFTS